MLTEQLLHGLGSREMYEIVAKKPAIFVEAYEIANALEATRKITNEVKESNSPAPEVTNKLGYGSPKIKREKKTLHKRSSVRGRNSSEITSTHRNIKTRVS